MRQNAPRLIEPKSAVSAATERSFGVAQPHDLLAMIDKLDRLVGDQNRELRQLRSLLSIGEALSFASPAIATTVNVKGSVTGTNVTSTSGQTITNSSLTLVPGIRYLIAGIAAMELNAPAGQSIISCVRIEATGSTVDGTRTPVTAGAFGFAIDFKTLIGTSSTVNIASRARVTGGTGVVGDALSAGIAIPIGMVEV